MKRKIKFFDLTKQYKSISKEINSKVIKVIRQGQYILGPNVNDFEKNFQRSSQPNMRSHVILVLIL